MQIIPLVTIVSGQPSAPTILLPGKPVELNAEEAKRLVDAEFATLAGATQPSSISKELIESIVDAIAELPRSDFAKDGKPNVKALQNILEFEVTAAQRDEAWEKFQQLSDTSTTHNAT